MVALLAEFEISAELDFRRSPRRKLKLLTEARNSNSALRATIEDLSRSGMLLHSAIEISEGDTIDVEFPEVGAVTARIKWTRGSFAGCEFTQELPQAAVSASLLLSPHFRLQDEAAPILHGRNPTRDLTGLAIGMLSVLLLGVFMLVIGMLIA